MSFNSHPHKEDDALVTSGIACATPFNSHPHKEDDLSVLLIYLLLLPFNSHPHKEDDCITLYFLAVKCLSTHILTRRMTFCNSFLLDARPLSTHILTRRMTTGSFRHFAWFKQPFNSHPHKEDDSNFKQKHSV